MPDWDFDENTKQGTLHLRRGGQIDHSTVVNGNTQNFDSHNTLISVVFANPAATMNLSGIPFAAEDHDRGREMIKNFPKFKTGG